MLISTGFQRITQHNWSEADPEIYLYIGFIWKAFIFLATNIIILKPTHEALCSHNDETIRKLHLVCNKRKCLNCKQETLLFSFNITFLFGSQLFVLVWFSVAAINAINKRKLGKRVYFILQAIYSPSYGQPRKRLQEGTQRQELNQSIVKLCFLWCVHPAFLYKPEPPAKEWHYPQWSGPLNINH